MASSGPQKRRYFSTVSYIALPYIAYLVLSVRINHYYGLERILSWTWLPLAFPLPVPSSTGSPTATMIVLQVVFVVADVYFWAWLITRIAELVAEVRRKKRKYEERNSNVP